MEMKTHLKNEDHAHTVRNEKLSAHLYTPSMPWVGGVEGEGRLRRRWNIIINRVILQHLSLVSGSVDVSQRHHSGMLIVESGW